MSAYVPRLPSVGKIDLRFFEAVIQPRLGVANSRVLVGPGPGLDNAILDLGHDQVLALTTDPLSLIPPLGEADSAWLSVHLVASDLITSGLAPQFASVILNLPPSLSAVRFERYWQAFHEECERLGVAIVAGHTGRYVGCDFTIIGGAVFLAAGPSSAYITPAMTRPGDALIVTKDVATVATAIFARVFPQTLRRHLGREAFDHARNMLHQLTVVPEARAAIAVGVRGQGVTAMHDATEGGVLGGIHEMASAARLGVRVEQDAIPCSDIAQSVCQLLRIDPYVTLSEGTLLLAAAPDRAGAVVQAIRGTGSEAALVGEFLPPDEGRWLHVNGHRRALKLMPTDPYWAAYWRAVQRRWK